MSCWAESVGSGGERDIEEKADGANVGTLTTGQTYIARRTEGEWTEVDGGNGVVGWIPTDAVHRAG